ncbi:chemotaxis protein CheC [Calderihabitans maritimus]|uniref:CheC, inhibitor of MCP methylation n=1 Tax=Calderihabitans maritimus TaxID=1246530 RepID=A0A1Z5HTT6_9FIRM|nr:chemotaxis protein CheC [Calderihabitans maritimus]GAW92949.1 CheC, inhibitor of MCP methylation [Calderihabitans maritimus]
MQWINLSPIHLDALKEIGNIGAGHAATALSKLVNQMVKMEVPEAGVIRFNDIFSMVGREDELVACVISKVSGKAPGSILFILDEKSAHALVDLMMGLKIGTTRELNDMTSSLLEELGNILTGAFLTALSQATNITLVPSVPALAFDMLGAVLSSAFLEGGCFAEEVLIIRTRFFNDQTKIDGHFFLVPEVKALSTILKSLGLSI